MLSTHLKSVLVKLGIIFPRFGVKLPKNTWSHNLVFLFKQPNAPPHPKKRLPWWYISCTNHIHSFFWCWKFAKKSPFVGTSFFLDVSLDLSCGLVCVVLYSAPLAACLSTQNFQKGQVADDDGTFFINPRSNSTNKTNICPRLFAKSFQKASALTYNLRDRQVWIHMNSHQNKYQNHMYLISSKDVYNFWQSANPYPYPRVPCETPSETPSHLATSPVMSQPSRNFSLASTWQWWKFFLPSSQRKT